MRWIAASGRCMCPRLSSTAPSSPSRIAAIPLASDLSSSACSSRRASSSSDTSSPGYELRLLDLGDQMTEIVGATLRLRLARGERLDLARDRQHALVRTAHACGQLRGGAEGIEDARAAIPHRAAFAPRAAHAGSRASVPTSASTAAVVVALLIHARVRPVETISRRSTTWRDRLRPHRARRAAAMSESSPERSNTPSTVALSAPVRMRSDVPRSPSRKSERADDDRFSGAGLTREHVEAGRQRQRQRVDDREIPIRSSVSTDVARRARGVLPTPASAAGVRRTCDPGKRR